MHLLWIDGRRLLYDVQKFEFLVKQAYNGLPAALLLLEKLLLDLQIDILFIAIGRVWFLPVPIPILQ